MDKKRFDKIKEIISAIAKINNDIPYNDMISIAEYVLDYCDKRLMLGVVETKK